MVNTNLSLVIPCYNEGTKLINNINIIRDYMRCHNIGCNYEIIIVNDGSKDDTLSICKDLEKQIDNVHIVTYENNRGKGYAVKEGIKHSKGEYVIFMDADLSTDLTAIKDSLKELKNYSVVVGSRRHKNSNLIKKQGILRRFIGKSCSILTNLIIPLHLPDTQCGFKCFNGDIAREIVKHQTLDGFSFDVELLYIAKLNGYTIGEIPVIWENDDDSKVSVLNSSLKFFIDLFKIRFKKSKYIFEQNQVEHSPTLI